MLTIEKLKAYGANVEEGMGRCLNNEPLYFRLIGMAAEDTAFSRLEESLHSGDLEAAFEAAHTLKGALGNMALEPMYRPVVELTELLRRKTPGDYDGLLSTIMAKRAELLAMIK